MDTEELVSEVLLAPIDERAEQILTAAAFEELVRTHQQQIYRILLLQLREHDAAETLTQEVFLRAYTARHTFRGEASIGTWLIRIALNLARDHVRSRRLAFWRRLGRTRPKGGDLGLPDRLPADPNPSPERHLLARERLAAVWAIVHRLPARQRTCFTLRYVEELSVAAIAEALQLQVGTVKAHLARAVGAIRQHLKESEQPCANI